MSTAQIAYFSMTIFTANELNEKMSEIIDPSLSPERRAQIEAERKEIAALDTGESVVNLCEMSMILQIETSFAERH